MPYTVEIWVMDGAGEQDPDFSFRYNSKNGLISFLHMVALDGGIDGSMIESMNIINDTTNNHMI